MTTTAEVYASADYIAFLAAILAEPEEDTHRLVLADWLEEKGEGERAEFIRVQCEIERTPPFVAPELCPLRRRESELWLARRSEWVARMLPHAQYLGGTLGDGGGYGGEWFWSPTGRPRDERRYALDCVEFRRGFVSRIELSAADWLAHCDSLHWHPLQTVECEGCYGVESHGAAGHANYKRSQCPVCSGTGRVARPVPATAQPITHVTLTTHVDMMAILELSGRAGMGEYAGNVISHHEAILGGCWKGVTFTLPR